MGRSRRPVRSPSHQERQRRRLTSCLAEMESIPAAERTDQDRELLSDLRRALMELRLPNGGR